MSTPVRLNVYLSRTLLDRAREKSGRSAAETIRRAITLNLAILEAAQGGKAIFLEGGGKERTRLIL